MVVNELYYGPGGKAPDNVAATPIDLSKAVKKAVEDIYNRRLNPNRELHPQLYKGILDTFDLAVAEGFKDKPAVRQDFKQLVLDNNEVFSAFKVHRLQKDVAAQMFDDEGKLKNFDRFASDVKGITSHQCRTWLRTEYDTAIKRAAQAADWQRFEDEKDVLPNLRWVPSTAATPGADHMVFWDTVRPIDDPFWSAHKPGDRWGCQCALEATDEPQTGIPDSSPKDEPAPGLENNPGKDGELFSDNHPYFSDSCSTCPFYRGAQSTAPSNRAKDCYHCQYVMNSMPDNDKNNYYSDVETKNGEIRIHSQHGENERNENIFIASYFANKYGDEIDLLPRDNSKKCADAYNRTHQLYQEYKKPLSASKTSIDNALRDADKKADVAILYLDTAITEDTLTRGIKGRIIQCRRLSSVIVVRNGADAAYSKEEILSPGWKASWTDLK